MRFRLLLFLALWPLWLFSATVDDRDREVCDQYRKDIEQASLTSPQSRIAQINLQTTLHEVNSLTLQAEQNERQLLRYHVGGFTLLLLVIGVSIYMLIRKMRHLRQSEKELHEALVQAEHSIYTKNLFLSNMSHEIRTPLNALSGFSTILIDKNIDDETRRQCNEIIHQNSELLIKLIDDVVDLSTLEKGHIHFTYQQTDAVTICRKVIETVNCIKQTAAEVRFDCDLDKLELTTDPARLQQLLINLLINATKFTSEGSITLSLTLSDEHTAQFCVTDTGCGIPLEQQPKIFTRFEKMHEQVSGSGLGLSICQLIVDEIGGKIWIDSSYTQGARFCFSHPLTHQQAVNSPKENETSKPFSVSLCIALITLFTLTSPKEAMAAPTVIPQAVELRQEITTMPAGRDRLEKLRQLVRITQMSDTGVKDTRMLLREAQEVGDDSLIAYSTTILINHFLTNKELKVDSIRHYADYALPIAHRCQYWAMYFRIKYIVIQSYIYAHSYEYAKDEAHKAVKEAEEAKAVNGQITAYSALAIAYQSTNQWQEAKEALLNAQKLFDQGAQTANKINILKQMLYLLYTTRTYREMPTYLKELEKELDTMMKKMPSMARALNDYYLLLHCYSIAAHVDSEEYDQADEHIKEFKRYARKLNYRPYFIIYTEILTNYYLGQGNFSKALALSDSLLHTRHREKLTATGLILCLEQRANIYYDMGEYASARLLYQEAKHKRDSISQIISDMQLEEYRNLYKTDKLKMANEQMELQRLHIVLIILSLIVAVLIITAIYLYRMKSALQRNSRSERQALMKAEEANQQKRDFLEQMSHAVRVPLNSVVGFSNLIVRDEELNDKEREEYAEIIKRNTNLLLYQVNSVLDLSRLEANMTKWQLGNCDLIELLQTSLNKALYLQPQLNIKTAIPPIRCVVHTDGMRLTQLFDSVLMGVEPEVKISGELIATAYSDGSKLTITVKGSPLAKADELNMRRNLRHQINQLTLAYFGGSYQLDLNTRTINLTYPLKNQ